ncbi:MAG TPA: hypothetical protein VHA37_02835, partial [Candidatus Saccharimonadales bacterium]|nr:hypothetical protein [Candidatus Saccharimonadales bacterium]
MADDEVVSRLRVEAVDDTGPVLRDISEKIERTKRTFETIGSGLLLGKAFNDFANVSRSMERLQFSANATTQQMKGLGREFDEISKSTGRSVDELARSFNTFMDISGQGMGPAIEQFRGLADAAKVTGVSMEGLARAAGAAVTDMQVPADQINDLINRWSKELPSTMLEQFSQMAPRLMQTMNSVGLTGKQNAEEIANAFSSIAQATGSPRAAFMGLNELLNNMNNAGSQLGKIMLPTLEGVRARGGDTLDMLNAMFNTMKQMGALDPQNRAWLQQSLGVDFNTIKTLQTLHDQLANIRERMKEGATASEAMAEAIDRFNNDPKSALDHLKGSVDQLTMSFADLMNSIGASSALQGLAKTMEQVSNAIDYVERRATGSSFEQRFNAVEGATPSGTGRAIITGTTSALGMVGGGALGSFVGPLGTLGGGALGLGSGHAVGERASNWLFGDMSEQQLRAYARAHGLAGPEAHAGGGIVTRPTLSTIAENGPEAIVPLTGGGGGGPSDNTQATKENTAALNRLASYMRDFGQRRRFAYTPGAGEVGVPDVAQVYGGVGTGGHYMYGGGGPGSGPMFRPGIGPGLHAAHGMPGGGTVPRHMGRSGNNTLPVDESSVSGTLSEQRKRMMQELNDDPQLRDFAIDAMQHEGGLQSNLEQLFNYAAMRHMTIRQALHSGQFGPVNHGMITGRISAATRAKGIAALQRVGAGSNITDYATDQGMAGDPNFAKYMANRSYYDMHKVEGAWFSYHGEAGRRWAERQRQNDARMAAAAAHGEHGARLSDMEHHRGRAGSVFDHGAPPVPNTSEHHAEN